MDGKKEKDEKKGGEKKKTTVKVVMKSDTGSKEEDVSILGGIKDFLKEVEQKAKEWYLNQ